TRHGLRHHARGARGTRMAGRPARDRPLRGRGHPPRRRCREAPADARLHPRLGPRAGAASMTPARVLVVDDDPHILEVLAMRLESLGLEVSAAASPGDVPGILADRSFDLALFDLRMAPLDGLTLLDIARE